MTKMKETSPFTVISNVFNSFELSWIAAIINLLLPWIIYHLWPVCFNFQLNVWNITIRVFAVVVFIKLRTFIKGAQYTKRTSATGKTVIITGANAGIGRALCSELASRGAHVHMLCRNQQKAEEARKALIKAGAPPNLLTIHFMDLSDLATVRSFAAKFIKEVGELDILVCNAGHMGMPTFHRTKDGHELTYQTNFLAHHLLSELLLPLLEKSSDGRIVNISSINHLLAKTARIEVCDNDKDYNAAGGLVAYNRSKLAQVLMTKEFAKHLHQRGSNTRVVVCHPGAVYSNFLQTDYLRFVTFTWLRPIIAFVLKTEKDGSQTPLHCCLDENICSGAYYHECLDAPWKLHTLYNDDKETKNLFEETRKALGVVE